MGKKLAIKGHETRGEEVIELLEMMGGNTFNSLMENAHPNRVYYIGNNNAIKWTNIYSDNGCLETEDFFTLEEFLEKYPFYVGYRVFDIVDGDPGIITAMKWDEDVSDMKYRVDFDNGDMGWYTNDTIGFLKKDGNLEETQSKREYNELRMPLDDDDKLATEVTIMGKRILPPDGYLVGKITQTDNGMLVEYVVEKKPKYPTTYEECCKVLGISYRAQLSYTYPDVERGNIYLTKEKYLLDVFMKLRICRNAYWMIAGEEMGLGKPWEPDWDEETDKFTISNKCNKIYLNNTAWYAEVLSFPTAEMRDAFYENFKELIEQCKELL